MDPQPCRCVQAYTPMIKKHTQTPLQGGGVFLNAASCFTPKIEWRPSADPKQGPDEPSGGLAMLSGKQLPPVVNAIGRQLQPARFLPCFGEKAAHISDKTQIKPLFLLISPSGSVHWGSNLRCSYSNLPVGGMGRSILLPGTKGKRAAPPLSIPQTEASWLGH